MAIFEGQAATYLEHSFVYQTPTLTPGPQVAAPHTHSHHIRSDRITTGQVRSDQIRLGHDVAATAQSAMGTSSNDRGSVDSPAQTATLPAPVPRFHQGQTPLWLQDRCPGSCRNGRGRCLQARCCLHRSQAADKQQVPAQKSLGLGGHGPHGGLPWLRRGFVRSAMWSQSYDRAQQTFQACKVVQS